MNALVAKIEVVGYVVEMDLSRSEFLRISDYCADDDVKTNY